MVYDEHSSFGAVEKCWVNRAVEKCWVNKLGVDVLLLMLCRLRFCKSFQADNYVYYDLNNRALDLLI